MFVLYLSDMTTWKIISRKDEKKLLITEFDGFTSTYVCSTFIYSATLHPLILENIYYMLSKNGFYPRWLLWWRLCKKNFSNNGNYFYSYFFFILTWKSHTMFINILHKLFSSSRSLWNVSEIDGKTCEKFLSVFRAGCGFSKKNKLF
jgi:hypothetical protein